MFDQIFSFKKRFGCCLFVGVELCREGFDEEEEQEEVENEVAPILVQLAYVHQLQGHQDEATKLYTTVLKNK